MNENPETPGTDRPADICLTDAAQRFLSQTKPWTRFMSIMAFIGSAFMIIAGFAVALLGPAFRAMPQDEPGLGVVAGIRAVAGIVYILLGILYIAPGVFLWKFSDAITLLGMNRSQQALEDALKHQKSFWRFVGILTIIGLAIAILAIAFSIIAAMFLMRRSMAS
jgi:hypothetical protein